jgi:hypothetical protein
MFWIKSFILEFVWCKQFFQMFLFANCHTLVFNWTLERTSDDDSRKARANSCICSEKGDFCILELSTSDRKISVSVSVSAEISVSVCLSVSVSVYFTLSVSAEISVRKRTENRNICCKDSEPFLSTEIQRQDCFCRTSKYTKP